MPNNSKQIRCRICRKTTPTDGCLCLGCGTPVENAIDNSKQRVRKPQCPKCNSGANYEIEPGRYSCRDCMGVFEADDFGYLDTRPDRNLEKLERLAERKKKQGRYK